MLDVLDIAIQNEINVLKKCKTLRDTLVVFETTYHNNMDALKLMVEKVNLAMNDQCFISKVDRCFFAISQELENKASNTMFIRKFVTRLLSMQLKTSLVA